MIYASYDRMPAHKGAAVHIDAFSRALGRAFGPVELVTVAGDPRRAMRASPQWRHPGVRHWQLPAHGPNLMQRVLTFRRALSQFLSRRRVEVIHVRSIFEGYPIAFNKQHHCRKLVYEVNGLPSIELKYHYPQVADDRELLTKLRAQEQVCLEAADLILTVSDVTAAHLETRGVLRERIVVIPNGVDTTTFSYQPPRQSPDGATRMLYCGTIASWQGVMTALEALALCLRDFPARLTIVGEARPRALGRLQRRARSLGVDPHVEILDAAPQSRLAALHHEADVALAPLKPNDRNLVQGCCPLKVLEAMASGTPLVASDLPVVRALAQDGVEAVLVKPGSAKAIKDGVLRLRQDPELASRLSAGARGRILEKFTWSQAEHDLLHAYQRMLGMTPASNACSASASMDE